MPKINAATVQEHRAAVTEALLNAWGELVMDRGFENVTLADVASSAGIARTAIYNYFPDVESLLFAWTEREVAGYMDAFSKKLSQAKSSRDKLELFIRLQLESFQERHLPPGQEAFSFLAPGTYAQFAKHLEPLEATLEQILAEGRDNKEFNCGEPKAVAPLVMSCIGAERVPVLSGQKKMKEALEQVTDFVLRAVGANS